MLDIINLLHDKTTKSMTDMKRVIYTTINSTRHLFYQTINRAYKQMCIYRMHTSVEDALIIGDIDFTWCSNGASLINTYPCSGGKKGSFCQKFIKSSKIM